jgi:hypothetical protein
MTSRENGCNSKIAESSIWGIPNTTMFLKMFNTTEHEGHHIASYNNIPIPDYIRGVAVTIRASYRFITVDE